ncbi:putative nucleotidyltransferases [Candidatus Termititenax persephonae]|uniref:Nucleotidyltransferases n=1 Tax=Candidatus Termititenax persephonae TaxID=2218525 RepID=A0A388TIN6_9BACT|nr:putative nucleotidyltransferases [Candidatus Termititenax persephonae]
MKTQTIINDLVCKLKASDPYRIVLFGSYAKGNLGPDSDVDLMVVLDNNDVARTHRERLGKKLATWELVREINYRVALDLLVYSKEELKKLREYGNSFIREVEATGKVLYEKRS